jgi:formylglycine-generating enzyme
MRAHTGYRWILLVGLASGACIPDVISSKPGVCMTGEKQCMGAGVQTCGSDYQWHDGQTCASPTPFCADGACTAVPPSCQSLPAQCGPSGAENCCLTLPVKDGTFQRVDHRYGAPDVGAVSSAMVSDFNLDRFEVTVGRFRNFVAFLQKGGAIPEGAGAHPAQPGDGWQSAWSAKLVDVPSALACDLHPTWTASPGDNDVLPINCVNWYAAFAFCAWDGGRLPTEAEWEYAATLNASGQKGVYPWGSEAPDDTRAVYCSSVSATEQNPCTDDKNPNRPGKVGSKSPAGDSPWGHADLAGNVWEWTLDSFAPYSDACQDCVSFPETNGDRQVRGGSWNYGAYALPGGLRTNHLETQFTEKLGVRCARSP